MVSENSKQGSVNFKSEWGSEVPLLLRGRYTWRGNVGGVGVCFNNSVTLEGSVSATISCTDGLVK